MRNKFYRRVKAVYLLISIFIVTFIGGILGVSVRASAQTSNELWSAVLNLSNSGSAKEPRMVLDANDRLHVIWQDTTGSFYYTYADEGVWTAPRVVEVPFGTRLYEPELRENQPTPLFTPLLRADGNGSIQALWSDSNRLLFHSSVRGVDVANFDLWSQRQQLAEAALAYDLVDDGQGLLHMVFIRPLDTELFPAGLYYRFSNDSGTSWSAPTLLYASSYFRALTPDLANVHIMAGEPGSLVVVWDNPGLERVLAIPSNNGGESWGEVQEIDRRVEGDSADAKGPHGIRVERHDGMFHLIWQAGHEGRDCALYHRVSSDGDSNWAAPEQLFSSIPDCATMFEMASDRDGMLYLLVGVAGDIYLSAWNGLQWSEPSLESDLGRFLDPQTFRVIELGCMQTFIAGADSGNFPQQLLVLGCDSSSPGDVWLRSRSVDSLAEQISPAETPIWQSAEKVATGDRLMSPILLADGDGWLHAFWSQTEAENSNDIGLHYSRWDGTIWSAPRIVLNMPASGATRPDITLDSNGRLLAVWSSGLPGELFFSQNTTATAGSAAEWSSPVQIPALLPVASTPSITTDSSGVIYVAFVLPLNEQRGVYIAKSIDGGSTWQGPIKVFDAVAAGVDMVDWPRISSTNDRALHIIWSRFASPPGAMPLGLQYARSTDGGATWSEPQNVFESRVVWSRLITVGDRIVHIVLLDEQDGLWHSISVDSGITWSPPQPIAGLDSKPGPSDITIDGAGRPLVVQVTESEFSEQPSSAQNGSILRQWSWNDGKWSQEESFTLGIDSVSDVAAGASVGGKLGVIYLGGDSEEVTAQDVDTLFFSKRNLELPDIQPTPLPTLTPTPIPMSTATATPQPEPTPTLQFPIDADDGEGLPLPIDNSLLSGPLIGIIPAGLVVIIAFFIGVRFLRNDRR